MYHRSCERALMARMNLEWDALPAQFPTFSSPERWLPLLRRHWELLEAAAPRVSVTSVEAGDAVQRHYAESLELLRIADECGWAGSIADVGSGGGFPGLVVACVRGDVRVVLIEPLQKARAPAGGVRRRPRAGERDGEGVAGRGRRARRGPGAGWACDRTSGGGTAGFAGIRGPARGGWRVVGLAKGVRTRRRRCGRGRSNRGAGGGTGRGGRADARAK